MAFNTTKVCFIVIKAFCLLPDPIIGQHLGDFMYVSYVRMSKSSVQLRFKFWLWKQKRADWCNNPPCSMLLSWSFCGQMDANKDDTALYLSAWHCSNFTNWNNLILQSTLVTITQRYFLSTVSLLNCFVNMLQQQNGSDMVERWGRLVRHWGRSKLVLIQCVFCAHIITNIKCM